MTNNRSNPFTGLLPVLRKESTHIRRDPIALFFLFLWQRGLAHIVFSPAPRCHKDMNEKAGSRFCSITIGLSCILIRAKTALVKTHV
jgi:hypothetical protein